MGIADIFEALTAKDRPYKKGKTLSESLAILGKMKLNGHVDPDLFDIFVREQGLPALRRAVPRPGADRRGRRDEDSGVRGLGSRAVALRWALRLRIIGEVVTRRDCANIDFRRACAATRRSATAIPEPYGVCTFAAQEGAV